MYQIRNNHFIDDDGRIVLLLVRVCVFELASCSYDANSFKRAG